VRDTRTQRRRLLIALGLAAAVFLVEALAAIFANSLALLAEAFHVLVDVAALGIAATALWLAGRQADERRTFGLLRLEILGTVLNTVLLLVVASVVLVEGLRRFSEPSQVQSGLVLLVGVVGLGLLRLEILGTVLNTVLLLVVASVVLVEGLRRFSEPSQVQSGLVLLVGVVGLASNGISIFLLRDPHASLVVRAAYLDVLSDVVGSAAVIVSALATILAGRQLADTLAAFLIVALIVPRAVTLLREAIDVLLEATPRGVDLEVLRRHVLACTGVSDIHDLHVWTITSGMNVLSAHVIVHAGADPNAVLDELESCLRGDFDIEHSTFQLESEDRKRLERAGHP